MKSFSPYKTFCALPFVSLLLNPKGTVHPCCWNQKLVAGKITGRNLKEIWNGGPMCALRREFLSGKIKSCCTQIRQIRCNEYFRDLESQIIREEVQTQGPKKLDVRLNGKCNLQCQMCDVWQEPNGFYEEKGFWQWGPEEVFPHLQSIDVLGGEPFIQKDSYRLIKEVTRVNNQCQWGFSTNANWKFSEAVRRHLDVIKIKWFQISLDSVVPDTYQRIRHGGNLERVLKTTDDLIDYGNGRKDFPLLVSMCVQKANWREIKPFIQYAGEKGLKPCFQYLYEPRPLSLGSLPREELVRVYEKTSQLADAYRESPVDFNPLLTPLRDLLG